MQTIVQLEVDMRLIKPSLLSVVLIFSLGTCWADDYEDCKSAYAEWSSKRDELLYRAKKLYNCAADQSNPTDDCSTEARYAKHAGEDFETEHSDVNNKCSEFKKW